MGPVSPAISERPVLLIIRYAVPRVECRRCGAVRQVKAKFAPGRRGYLKSFERLVLRLLRAMTIQDGARLLKVSWDTLKDISKRYLTRRFRRPGLKRVRRIAIDEISLGKGHRYFTFVLGLDTRRGLFVGKGADALRSFWRKVRACKQCKLVSVAIDMSLSYIQSVMLNAPQQAHLVFDRFPIMQLCNRMLSQLRRALYCELTDAQQKHVLKGIRWLLLTNPDNL